MELIRTKATAIHDAFQRSDWQLFAFVKRHDHLLACLGVASFLVAAFLRCQCEAIAAEDPHHFRSGQPWQTFGHQAASSTSTTLLPRPTLTGEGSR